MPDYRPVPFSMLRTLLLSSTFVLLGAALVVLFLSLREAGPWWSARDQEAPLELGDGPLAASRSSRAPPAAAVDLSAAHERVIEFVLLVRGTDGRGLPTRVRLSLPPTLTVHGVLQLPSPDDPMPVGCVVARTDDDGRLLVRARKEKFRINLTPTDARVAPFLGTIAVDEDWAGQEVKITRDLRRGAISGTVRGLEGAAAQVTLDAETQARRKVAVRADGQYAFEHVAAGRHRLDLELGAQASQFLPVQPASCYLAEDQVRRSLDIDVHRAAMLVGVVVDRAGRPVAGVRLRASTPGSERAVTAVSDERGAYRLPSLDPGPQRVAMLHPWQERALAAPMAVTAALGEQVLALSLEPQRAGVKGRLVGPDGEPIGGARVAALLPLELRLGEQVTGADGEFLIDGLLCGPYPLAVTTPDASYRARADIVLQAMPQPPLQVIRLERTATLVIVPKGGGMTSVGPWLVTVRGEDSFFRFQEYPGGSAELEMAGLPSGSLEVRMALGASSAERQRLWHVQLEPGARERLVETD